MYSTLSTKLHCEEAVNFGSVTRPHAYFMSSVSTARPLTGAMLWNFASRSFMVHVSPSGLFSALSTRSGTGFKSARATPGPALYLKAGCARTW